MTDDPVTIWLDQLRDADDTAARKLWQHFMRRLLDTARRKLQDKTHRVYDEEDAAQSAFRSVCIGISEGRFPDLHDRDSLLGLLLSITARKVARRHEHDHRQRRDVNRELTDCIFVNSANGPVIASEQLHSREPTPDFVAEFSDICESLFRSLDDDKLKEIVTLRLSGHTDSEVAARLRCSRRTVQRKLEIIRRHWSRLELARK